MNDGQGIETTESENLIAQAIDAAEDISDPLDGLVKKTGADPSAAFSPKVLETPPGDRRRLRGAPALYRPGRGVV